MIDDRGVDQQLAFAEAMATLGNYDGAIDSLQAYLRRQPDTRLERRLA